MTTLDIRPIDVNANQDRAIATDRSKKIVKELAAIEPSTEILHLSETSRTELDTLASSVMSKVNGAFPEALAMAEDFEKAYTAALERLDTLQLSAEAVDKLKTAVTQQIDQLKARQVEMIMTATQTTEELLVYAVLTALSICKRNSLDSYDQFADLINIAEKLGLDTSSFVEDEDRLSQNPVTPGINEVTQEPTQESQESNEVPNAGTEDDKGIVDTLLAKIEQTKSLIDIMNSLNEGRNFPVQALAILSNEVEESIAKIELAVEQSILYKERLIENARKVQSEYYDRIASIKERVLELRELFRNYSEQIQEVLVGEASLGILAAAGEIDSTLSSELRRFGNGLSGPVSYEQPYDVLDTLARENEPEAAEHVDAVTRAARIVQANGRTEYSRITAARTHDLSREETYTAVQVERGKNLLVESVGIVAAHITATAELEADLASRRVLYANKAEMANRQQLRR